MHLSRALALLLTLASAALGAAPAAALAGADESTSFQVTPGHTGFLSGGSLERPPLRERWTRALGGSTSFPLVAGGRVFVVAHDDADPQDGVLHALDAATGATVWSRFVGEEALVAYENGRVFVSERDGTVLALAADSGLPLWTRELPKPFSPQPPVAVDGVLYVSTAWSNGYLYALDVRNGTTTWRSAPQIDSGIPTVDGTYVHVAADGGGRVSAFSRADGRTAWNVGDECFVGPGRLVADGARVFGPYNGGCGSIVDAATGLDQFTIPFSNALSIAGDVAVLRDGETLRANSLRTGAVVWELTGAGLASPPLIVNHTVYAGAADGSLHAVDLNTGAPLWQGPVAGAGAPAGSAGMAAGGGVLVVPAGGSVSAFESTQAPRPGLGLRITGGPDGPTRATAATMTFASTTQLDPQRCRLDGGAWSPCVATVLHADLAEGPHSFEVQTLDESGDPVALAARGWSVDTTAPTATFSSGPSGMLTTGIALAKIALADQDREARLECRLDDEPWKTCQTSVYEREVEYAGLDEGPHRLQVRASDPLGNVQATPDTRTWIVDTIAPTLTLSLGPPSGTTTTTTSATFAFSTDEPATVTCSLDDGPFSACASPYTVQGLHDGHHVVRVSSVDPAGNSNSSSSGLRFWTVQDPATATTPPDSYFFGTPRSPNAERTATFRFAADESATYECRVDGAAWERCWSPWDAGGLGHGEHTVDVRATDSTGNVEPGPASFTWLVDTIAPHTTVAMDPASGPQTGYRFTFTADEAGSTFECLMDRAGWDACESGIVYSDLAPGEHEFGVRAVDPAGNRDTERPAVVFTVPAPPAPPPPPPADPPPPPPADPPTQGDPPPADPQPPPAAPAATPPAEDAPAPASAARVPNPASPPSRTAAPAFTPPTDATALAHMSAASTRSTLARASRSRLLTAPPKVVLRAGGPGRATLRLTMRQGGRTVTFARAAATFRAAGRRTVKLRLTAAGRRSLRRTTAKALRLVVRSDVRPERGRAGTARSSVRV